MTYLPDGDRSRAVLIGTSTFSSPDLAPLPAVNNNLYALFQALTDPETGILPERNCEIVQSPDSPDSFMQRLRGKANEAEDLLLVYYAGHGLRHEKRDDLYLSVRQTNPAGLDGSAVEYEWVRDLIADSPARSRLLILDCCYSGLAVGRMAGPGVDPRELAVSGTSVMASSPRNKQSHSPVGERHTAFTGELLALLEHGSPLADRSLTVANAHQSIKAALARRALPLPTLRSDDTSGQVLLRRAPVRQVPTPPARQAPPPPPLPIQPPPPPLPPVQPPRPVPTPVAPSHAAVTARIAPVPAPTVTRPAPRSPSPRLIERVATLIRRVPRPGLTVLWMFALVGTPMMIGGLVGVLFGPVATKGGDTSILSVGSVMVVPLAVGVVRRRRRGAAVLLSFARVPRGVLIALVLFFVGVASGVAFQTPTGTKPGTTSDIGAAVGTPTLMLAVAVLFGLALWARRRSARDQASAGDQREVQGGE
jgi:caspase domain-containing protein